MIADLNIKPYFFTLALVIALIAAYGSSHASPYQPPKEEVIVYAPVQEKKVEPAKPLKPVTIRWEKVNYAAGYRVIIKTGSGKLVGEKETDKPFIEIILDPGDYELQIGVITPFGTVGTWSDWKKFKIEQKKPAPRPVLAPVGFFAAPGATYGFLLPPLDARISYAYPGALIGLGIFGTAGAWRWLGIELEGFYSRYAGKLTYTKFNTMGGGLNLFMITRFAFPLNLMVRLGGGAMANRYEYYDIPTSAMKEIWSVDYYAQAGLALDWAFYRDYFLQLGVDYQMAFYLNSIGHGLRVRLAAGFRPGWNSNYFWAGKDEPISDKEEKMPAMGFLVALGYSAHHILPFAGWSENLSFTGGILHLGLYGKKGVLKWFGLEAEGGYQYTLTSGSTQHAIAGGASLRISTPFDFPVNAVLRIGGGLLFSHYTSATGSISFWSMDTYYKAGLGAEFRILGPWFIELGAEYRYIAYAATGAHSLRYYLLTGLKL